MASKDHVFESAGCQNKSIQILLQTKNKALKTKKEKENFNKYDGLFNYLDINLIVLSCTDPKNVLTEENVVSKCTPVSLRSLLKLFTRN